MLKADKNMIPGNKRGNLTNNSDKEASKDILLSLFLLVAGIKKRINIIKRINKLIKVIILLKKL